MSYCNIACVVTSNFYQLSYAFDMFLATLIDFQMFHHIYNIIF